jgi:hypothetical protein
MPAFKNLVRSLRKAEAELARQLEGIRQAISTLEFGGAASPSVPRAARKRGGGKRASVGRKLRCRRRPGPLSPERRSGGGRSSDAKPNSQLLDGWWLDSRDWCGSHGRYPF